MDTTETYIQMCEKAVEIQRGHYGIGGGGWETGDFYCAFIYPNVDNGNIFRVHDIPNIVDLGTAYDTGKIPGKHERWLNLDAIWLPRQDQLQEMLLNPVNTQFPDILTLLRFFSIFVAVNSQFSTMEQLWLAFVMKKKYGKEWSGEEWKQTYDYTYKGEIISKQD